MSKEEDSGVVIYRYIFIVKRCKSESEIMFCRIPWIAIGMTSRMLTVAGSEVFS